MFDEKGYLLSNESTFKKFGIKGTELITSWSKHYNSWVHNKYDIPICLIKYENLLKNTSKEFIKIFNFLKKINKEKNISVDNDRLKNTIKETSFDNLEMRLKTSKEEIKIKLEEFLEIEKITPTFKNKQIGEILKHFRNWLNYNKPKEITNKLTKAPWLNK